jgi:hypothetical protein
MLASPSASVRQRLPKLVPYCPGLADVIWPDLVAALSSSDGAFRDAVLPLFLDLTADLDRVAVELRALADEPDAGRAAAARLALALIGEGLWPDSEGASEGLWRHVEEMASKGLAMPYFRLRFHARLRGAPEEARQRLRWLTYAGACRTESEMTPAFEAMLRAPEAFDGAQLSLHANTDPWWCEATYGVVLHCGEAAYRYYKIPLIKVYRTDTNAGLKESKDAVEGAFDRLIGNPAPGPRREAIRHLFLQALPPRVAELLEHPVSWFRWCGLVVLEYWGERGRLFQATVEARLEDAAPHVREQAARTMAALE